MNYRPIPTSRRKWTIATVITGCCIIPTLLWLQHRQEQQAMVAARRRADEALTYLVSRGAGTHRSNWKLEVNDPTAVDRIFFNFNLSLADDDAMTRVGEFKNLRIFGVSESTAIGSGDDHLYAKFGDKQLRPLFGLPQLEEVYVEYTGITDAGLLQLAACPRLKYVCVKKTKVTANGIAEFKRRRSDCQIIEAVGEYSRIDGFYMTDFSKDSLRLATKLPSVKEFGTYGSRTRTYDICDDEMEILAQLPDLEIITNTGIDCLTDEGIEHLHGHPSLKEIALSHRSVTTRGIERLKESIRKQGRELIVR